MQKKGRIGYGVLFLAFCACGYLIYNYGSGVSSDINAPIVSNSVSKNETAESMEDNSSANLDNNWTEWVDYTSIQGISFKYPKTSWGFCDGVNAEVAMKVIEDQKSGYIYITADCADTLATLQKKMEEVAVYENDMDGYQQEKFFYGWSIALKDIKEESELNDFVKAHYAKGCKVQDKTDSFQSGVYRISLNQYKDAQGDSVGLDETVCPANYVYDIFYSPKAQKALSVVLGQECTFAPNADLSGCYDDEMAKSIKFN